MKIFNTLSLFLLSLTQLQAETLPNVLWQSKSLGQSLTGVAVAVQAQCPNPFIIVTSFNQLTVFELIDGQLIQRFQQKGSAQDHWIKLSAFDLDGDGSSELLVSGFRRGRPYSFLVRLESDQLEVLLQLDEHAKFLSIGDKPELVSQKALGAQSFSGPLSVWKHQNAHWVRDQRLALPGGLSGETLPLFSLLLEAQAGDSMALLALNREGRVARYVRDKQKPWKKNWAGAGAYGGSSVYFKQKIKNVLQQTESDYFILPASLYSGADLVRSFPWPQTDLVPLKFWRHYQQTDKTIYLIHHEGTLKGLAGRLPLIKQAQIIRLRANDLGYQEAWISPRFDGAIADLSLIDWDEDGHEDILAILTNDNQQDSFLIVIKPN